MSKNNFKKIGGEWSTLSKAYNKKVQAILDGKVETPMDILEVMKIRNDQQELRDLEDSIFEMI